MGVSWWVGQGKYKESKEIKVAPYCTGAREKKKTKKNRDNKGCGNSREDRGVYIVSSDNVVAESKSGKSETPYLIRVTPKPNAQR
jgi:hypothetical protein